MIVLLVVGIIAKVLPVQVLFKDYKRDAISLAHKEIITCILLCNSWCPALKPKTLEMHFDSTLQHSSVSLYAIFLERQWRTRHRRSLGSAVVPGHIYELLHDLEISTPEILLRHYNMTSRQTLKPTTNNMNLKKHQFENFRLKRIIFCFCLFNDYLYLHLSHKNMVGSRVEVSV